jgi:hypothetical protein
MHLVVFAPAFTLFLGDSEYSHKVEIADSLGRCTILKKIKLMTYTKKMIQLERIVNKHIAAFTAKDVSIMTHKQSFLIPNSTQLLYLDNNDNTFSQIFSIKSPEQKKIQRPYFHYKSFDLAYKFIDEGYFTASALSNFIHSTGDIKKSDIKEYEHFFEVTKIAYSQTFIDSQRDNLFIFCLTEGNQIERFWVDYVSDHKGICFEFEFIEKPNLQPYIFELRQICYDDGSDFKFYSEMQDEIYSNFNRYLVTPGIAKFGALYKRKNLFEWEKEARLLFDWGIYKAKLTENSIAEFTYASKRYLKIPFESHLRLAHFSKSFKLDNRWIFRSDYFC